MIVKTDLRKQQISESKNKTKTIFCELKISLSEIQTKLSMMFCERLSSTPDLCVHQKNRYTFWKSYIFFVFLF